MTGKARATKATAKATSSTVDVVLDLDTVEREGGTPAPFVFRHHGRVYTCVDPREIDWQNLVAAMQNPVAFLRYTMNDDDVNAFFSATTPEWKMERLVKAYYLHFGITEEDLKKGESQGLPGS